MSGWGVLCFVLFFFFNDTATTEIYTLSLHDALPILERGSCYGESGTRVGCDDIWNLRCICYVGSLAKDSYCALRDCLSDMRVPIGRLPDNSHEQVARRNVARIVCDTTNLRIAADGQGGLCFRHERE